MTKRLILCLLLAFPALAAPVFPRDSLILAGHKVTVEMASTPEQLAYGLMNRRKLAENAGMLFDFGQEQPVTMWMKNTRIPLDMLFIDKAGRIVYIKHNATPMSEAQIKADRPVRAVLELAGGVAETWGIKAGDTITHPLFTGR